MTRRGRLHRSTARLLDCSTLGWRMLLGGVLCLVVAVLFFREFWLGVPGLLGAESLRRNGVYGWGTLGVCLFWLFLKKDAIWRRMKESSSRRSAVGSPGRRGIFQSFNLSIFQSAWLVAGLAITSAALALPGPNAFVQVFKMLGAFLGIFVIFFGVAAAIPAFVLAVYGFSLAFPVVTQPLAEGVWGRATLSLVVALAPLFGLSLDASGNMVAVTGPAGERISALVTYECAGQITTGIFLALFALMMMDIYVPWKRALPLLIFGILGTTAQNLVRIEAILLSAQWWGWAGWNNAHQYVAYVVFPLWYAVFAMVYFKVAARKVR